MLGTNLYKLNDIQTNSKGDDTIQRKTERHGNKRKKLLFRSEHIIADKSEEELKF